MKIIRKSTLLALAATTMLWATGTIIVLTLTTTTAAAQDNAAYLAGLTDAVAADPDNAAQIVKDALEAKRSEIEANPGLALDIVLAVIAGLPEDAMTPNAISSILDAAVGVLDTLPESLSKVSSDVIKAVLASLPDDLANAVRDQISGGQSSSLKTQLGLLQSVTPPGGTFTSNPNDQGEDQTTDEKDVTDVSPN